MLFYITGRQMKQNKQTIVCVQQILRSSCEYAQSDTLSLAHIVVKNSDPNIQHAEICYFCPQ